MNAQQIEQLVQNLLGFVISEIAQNQEVVSILNKNSGIVIMIASVIMPIIDTLKADLPQYAAAFDLIEALYNDAKASGLVK